MHMKKRTAFIIMFVLGFAGALIAADVTDLAKNTEVGVEKHGQVTNYYAKKDPIRYAESVIKKTDAEKKGLWNYVQNNPDKVTPITYMALADYIFALGDKNDGLFWYYVGSLRAYEDLHMCDDKTAWAQVQIYPMLAPKTAEYSGTLSADERGKLTKKALKWDEEHSKRVNPEWACYHGMEVFSKGKVTTKPLSEYPAVQKEFREKVLKSLSGRN